MSSVSYNTPISEMTGSTASFTSSIPKKLCRYNVEADLLTSKSEYNPARRFYKCIYRMDDDDCKYFEWFDPPLPPFQKGCFVKLKARKDQLEEQLKCKVIMEKLLSERLNMKTSELDRMKEIHAEITRKNSELEMKIQAKKQKKNVRKKLIGVMMLVIVVVVAVLSVYLFKGVAEVDKLMLK